MNYDDAIPWANWIEMGGLFAALLYMIWTHQRIMHTITERLGSQFERVVIALQELRATTKIAGELSRKEHEGIVRALETLTQTVLLGDRRVSEERRERGRVESTG